MNWKNNPPFSALSSGKTSPPTSPPSNKTSKSQAIHHCSVDTALSKIDLLKAAAIVALHEPPDLSDPADQAALLNSMRSFYKRMDSEGFWNFVMERKKDAESLRSQMPIALADYIDPPTFVIRRSLPVGTLLLQVM